MDVWLKMLYINAIKVFFFFYINILRIERSIEMNLSMDSIDHGRYQSNKYNTT